MANQPKNYRKFLAGSVTAALVASAVAPTASAAAGFSDVGNDNHTENIEKAVAWELINGYDDNTFRPYQDISRGQVAKIIARYLGDVDTTGVDQFSDVEKSGDTELHGAALTVRAAEIFTGRNGELDFEKNITREEMASVIARLFEHLVDIEDVESSVTDIEAAFPVHQDNINLLSEWGITDQEVFNPKGSLKRAQFVTFMVRAIESIDAAPEVESVNAIDATTLSVTLSNGDTVEVTLEEALVEGTNEVTFVIEGVEYTETVEFDVVHTSGLSGFIHDGTDAVEGATVTVNGATATTDADGYYELLDVAAGTYEVTVEADGYETVNVADVAILEDEVTAWSQDIAEIDTTEIAVSGMIVDGATGEALNADVALESYDADTDTWVEVASVTATSGAYTIDQDDAAPDLELGAEYRQTVSLNGYHKFVQTIKLDDQEVANALAGIELNEIAALDVTGKITDADSVEVAAATVKIFDANGVQQGTDLTTGVDGKYSLMDAQLLSGTYNVVVNDGESAVSYSEFEVVEGTDVTHNVQLEEGFEIATTIGTESLNDEFAAGTYTLEVMSGNTVVADEDIILADVSDTLTKTLTRIASGEYTLRISGNNVVTEEFAVTVDGNETFEDRAVPAGTIAGTITASSGTVAGATVNLLNEDGEVVDTIETDDTYTFGGVATGKYTVEVSQNGFVTEESAVATVSKNADTTGVNVEIDEVVTDANVSGYVRVNGSLSPVDTASVVYYNKDREVAYSTTTNATGAYAIADVEAGTYDVVVRDDNDGVETHVTTQTVEAGKDLTALNYNLTKGGNASLEISVVDSEGNAVDVHADGFDLTDAFTFNDETLAAGFWEGAGDGPTDTFTFTGLSAGTYDLDLDIASDEYVDVDTTVTLASGETGELEIVVEEVAAQSAVNFRVVSETNEDVNDAIVVVFNEDGTIKTTLTSGDKTVALVDGNYNLAVYKNGYVVAKRDVTVAGKAVTVPVIQLSPIK